MAAAPSPTNIPLPNNLAAGATTRHTTHRLWASSVSASSQAHEHNDRNATLPSPVQQQHPGKVQGRSRSLLPRLLRATGYHLATHTRTAATPHACKQNLPAAGRLSPYTRLMSHSPSAMRRMLGHPGDDDPRRWGAGTGYSGDGCRLQRWRGDGHQCIAGGEVDPCMCTCTCLTGPIRLWWYSCGPHQPFRSQCTANPHVHRCMRHATPSVAHAHRLRP